MLRNNMTNQTRLDIWEDFSKDMSLPDIAAKYGLSVAAVDEFTKREKLAQNYSEPVKNLRERIYTLEANNVSGGTRLFNSLMRSQKIKSLEDLKSFTPNDIARINGIGNRAVEMLTKAGLLKEA